MRVLSGNFSLPMGSLNLLHTDPARHPVLGGYWRLMRLDKPVGTLLILWPTLWSLWLASEGQPGLKLTFIFIAGTFLMRAAGCVINDYADRHVDGKVARTTQRPLASGELKPHQALRLFFSLCLAAFLLVLLTNQLTIAMSLVGALLASIYPFLKRFTHLPQVWLGLAMNWGIVMAWTAVTGSLSREIWVFYLAAIFWTIAYDTCYAMVDREDDLRIGVKSIAILFGDLDRLMIGVLQVFTICSLLLGGHSFDLGVSFYVAVAAVACLFIYQQWLIRGREGPACFQAFMNNRWVGLVLFLGILVHYLL